jgi:hypothetical protein
MAKSKNNTESKTQSIDNSSGPNLFSRDENGLLKNIQYSFNEDGSINWREMVGEEHLFPNKSWFQSRGKDMPRSIDGLSDYQLLIKLSGIKELAKLRGFSDVSYDVVKCEEDHVSVICTVTFLPNYETFGEPVTFQDMANATLNNTSSFATKFLETIACNRAFVRCVRNFLQVHIVGDDEIDKSESGQSISAPKKSAGNPLSPSSLLEKKAKESLSCDSFEEFRKEHIKKWWQDKIDGIYQNDAIKNAERWEDIPAKETRIMLSLISN